MINNKLLAPKPKKLNPFISNNYNRSSFENNLFYRNSAKIKNENVFKDNYPIKAEFNLENLNDFERDFEEFEARSEIFSILQSDNTCSTSFFQRDSRVSNFTFDLNEERSYISLRASTMDSNNIKS